MVENSNQDKVNQYTALLEVINKGKYKSTVRNCKELTQEKLAAFLEDYCQSARVIASCRKVKLSNFTIYYLREADPTFRMLFDLCREISWKGLEDEAYRRAVKGYLKPIYYEGECVGHERRYSDTLLIFLMKANMREKYGDRVDIAADLNLEGARERLRTMFNRMKPKDKPKKAPPKDKPKGKGKR